MAGKRGRDEAGEESRGQLTKDLIKNIREWVL